jgi:hypothetical protein
MTFPFLVYQALVDVLVEDVVEFDLAVLLHLLVGDPLGSVGTEVLGSESSSTSLPVGLSSAQSVTGSILYQPS